MTEPGGWLLWLPGSGEIRLKTERADVIAGSWEVAGFEPVAGPAGLVVSAAKTDEDGDPVTTAVTEIEPPRLHSTTSGTPFGPAVTRVELLTRGDRTDVSIHAELQWIPGSMHLARRALLTLRIKRGTRRALAKIKVELESGAWPIEGPVADFVSDEPPSLLLGREEHDLDGLDVPMGMQGAVDRVLGYIAARERWERWANDFSMRGDADRVPVAEWLTPIDRSYHAMLDEFFLGSVIGDRNAAFGQPPFVSLAKTQVSAVRATSVAVVVSTVEGQSPPPGPDDVEYELVRGEGKWMLTDRRTRDPDGGWIKDVF